MKAKSQDADIIVVGGGIVGLSTAMQLTERYPGAAILVLEKEAGCALHQTGRNSGVIHAGVYYVPGSLKARFCREGSTATYAFAATHNIPTERCGKLVVATSALEVERLNALRERCVANGLEPKVLDRCGLRRLEPNIDGQAALLVRSSGITDYAAITRKMAQLVASRGGRLEFEAEVVGLREGKDGVVVETAKGTFHAGHAILCAGLMADRLMRLCGLKADFRIVPFRGEYFRLPASHNQMVSHLIYPVPDPSLPFLGVHLTRMIGGYITVGPNAVLALAREGYRWRDINFCDLGEMTSFPGLWKVLGRNYRSAFTEVKNSIFRKGYLELCRKYCPGLKLEDLSAHPSGVRAQAILADGTLVHDFLIRRGRRTLHICNAPSPAATSALPIGAYLIREFEMAFGAGGATAKSQGNCRTFSTFSVVPRM